MENTKQQATGQKICAYCGKLITGEVVSVQNTRCQNKTVLKSYTTYVHPVCARRMAED